MTNHKLKRYIKIFLILLCAAFIIDQLLRWYMFKDDPAFVDQVLKEIKGNNVLLDSIGGLKNYSYSYNKHEIETQDTVSFEIIIFGKSKDIIYTGAAAKTSKTDWKILSETYQNQNSDR